MNVLSVVTILALEHIGVEAYIIRTVTRHWSQMAAARIHTINGKCCTVMLRGDATAKCGHVYNIRFYVLHLQYLFSV